MGRWFRFYDDAINDPKILKLPEASRWHWLALLCVASKNDGVLPATDDVALMLRIKPSAAAAILAQMKMAGLLDYVDGVFSPHNWNGRQYKSDVSTERVKRFRNGQRNVSETPPETEAETEQKSDIQAVAKATRPTNEKFEEFWKVKPRRAGADPKAPAEKLFLAAVKAGTSADEIIAAARRWAVIDAGKIGTEFLPQAVKWLRDKRFNDYPPGGEVVANDKLAPDDAIVQFKKLGMWSKHSPFKDISQVPPELLTRHGLLSDGRKINAA